MKIISKNCIMKLWFGVLWITIFCWDCKSQVAKTRSMDFSGGPVVKNLPSSARDTSSIPGRGTKISHGKPQLEGGHAAAWEVFCHNCRTRVLWGPRSTTREACTATKTQCSPENATTTNKKLGQEKFCEPFLETGLKGNNYTACWPVVCVCYALSHVRLFCDPPWTVDRQAPLYMGFLRQEYWGGGCHFLVQEIYLPDPGIKPGFPALHTVSLPAEPAGKPVGLFRMK